MLTKLTKEYITDLKSSSNDVLASLISSQKDAKSVNFILENFGHLPKDFVPSFLYELLHHKVGMDRTSTYKLSRKANPSFCTIVVCLCTILEWILD
jgi:DNA-binding phage protein